MVERRADMRKSRKLCAMASALALWCSFASGGAVQAQGTAAASQPAPACPADDGLLTSPLVLRFRELALTPGGKIDPATLMKEPGAAEFIGKVMQAEQARLKLDWSGLCRYREANTAQLATGAPDVVFLGDSITEYWLHGDPSLFSARVIDRGISGQTTSQILLRLYPDVIALRPKVVHIMAGTNDVLQSLGSIRDDDIVNNISAMIDLAKANQVKVVLASILPISARPGRPDPNPAPRVIRLNERLRSLAQLRRVAFIDYYAVLKDAENGLSAALANDGVHPNRAGYAAMRPLTDAALAAARKGRR